jgi:hypothetical protein
MADCYLVSTDGGLTSRDPCGGSACLPWHAIDWNAAAGWYVRQVELVAVTPEERAFAAELRARFNVLDTDVPSPWSLAQRVADYVLLSQQANCALASKAAPPPPPGGAPPEEPSWWEEWLPSMPSMPSLPSWPSLPGLPSFSWPTIPPWVWYAGGAVLLLWLLSQQESRR